MYELRRDNVRIEFSSLTAALAREQHTISVISQSETVSLISQYRRNVADMRARALFCTYCNIPFQTFVSFLSFLKIMRQKIDRELLTEVLSHHEI